MAKVLTGVVISTKMQKTIVFSVTSKVKHPLYKKLITRTSRHKAHDEIGVSVGDSVKVTEVKPISKHVHFKVLEIVKNEKR